MRTKMSEDYSADIGGHGESFAFCESLKFASMLRVQVKNYF